MQRKGQNKQKKLKTKKKHNRPVKVKGKGKLERIINGKWESKKREEETRN